MLDDLKHRGVKFKSLTEAIDTETPRGRAMWQMIGVLAELERSLIVERTQAGMKQARRRGVKFGRKKNPAPAQVTKARKADRAGRTYRRRCSALERRKNYSVPRDGNIEERVDC